MWLTLSQTINIRLLNSKNLQTTHAHLTNLNVENFCKRVEKVVRKEEIAHYEQFLLFHRVFNRLVLQTRKSIHELIWEWGYKDMKNKARRKLFILHQTEHQTSKFEVFADFRLTLTQTTNFKLFQIERVCRRQFLS